MSSGGSGVVEFLPVHSQLNKAVSEDWDALLHAGTAASLSVAASPLVQMFYV